MLNAQFSPVKLGRVPIIINCSECNKQMTANEVGVKEPCLLGLGSWARTESSKMENIIISAPLLFTWLLIQNPWSCCSHLCSPFCSLKPARVLSNWAAAGWRQGWGWVTSGSVTSIFGSQINQFTGCSLSLISPFLKEKTKIIFTVALWWE